jgi:hypothetical protein
MIAFPALVLTILMAEVPKSTPIGNGLRTTEPNSTPIAMIDRVEKSSK